MEKKTVGYIVVGISALIGLIIFAFNRALTDIVNTACSHGPECPMWGSIRFQTTVSLGIMLAIIGVGIYLILSDRPIKKIAKSHTKLTGDENKIVKLLEKNDGTMFQSDMVEKTEFTKVKITRLLDRLEGKKIVHRRRRGMTNVVILD